MGYLVIARKYRPQKFDDVVGQQHIGQTLKNAISLGRLAHAYLFAGPSGVGKTTTARILAKSINCEHGPTPDPCQQCVSCQEITNGTSLDVTEIDAASNRGIDEIRELREHVKLAPASCRQKVYIIDEAHQITSQGFNAFLKTLEEPPAHITFIMATTEPNRIPATILCRCQRFTFRLVSTDQISQQLKSIVHQEIKEGRKIDITDPALNLIARLSRGSVRDAESLLDQLLSFSQKSITPEEIIALLGLVPDEVLHQFVDTFNTRNTTRGLALITETTNAGYGIYQVTHDLREYVRTLWLAKKNSLSPDEFTQTRSAELTRYATNFDDTQLWYWMKLLSQCLEEMKWSDHPKLVLDIYIGALTQDTYELTELKKKVENLEKKITIVPLPTPMTPNVSEPPVKPHSENSEPVIVQNQNVTLDTRPVENKTNSHPGTITLTPEEAWDQLTSVVNNEYPLVAQYLTTVKVNNIVGDKIYLKVENSFIQSGIEKNRTLLESLLTQFMGVSISLQFNVNEPTGQNEPERIPPVIIEEQVEEKTDEIVVEPHPIKVKTNDWESDVIKKIRKHFPQAYIVENKT